jgi:2-polyprenyl-3-methyl-5-hydroxy-6-metoxy-1,4-benzoquinol methylase
MEYQLQTIDCPFCNSSRHEVYIKGAKELYNSTGEIFNIVKCQECDFIFTNPRPTKDSMAFFYPDSAGYYRPSPNCLAEKDSFKKNILDSVLRHCLNYDVKARYGVIPSRLLKLFLARRNTLLCTPRFVEGGRLLDIGCSWGGYLSQMRDYGWDAYGTEINEKAVRYAQQHLGLENVKVGFFEDISWKENYFDAVNMNMVLEHLYDPLKTLRLVHSLMKTSGQLIISVPDISGAEARLYKDKAYTLHVPQHLSHFTPKTITKFLNKAGFCVEKIVHHQFDRDLVASADYLENKGLSKFLHNVLVRKTLVRITVNLLSLLEKTSRMSVYARKPNA